MTSTQPPTQPVARPRIGQPKTVDLGWLGDWTSWLSWLILLIVLPFSAISISGFTWLPALFLSDGLSDFIRYLVIFSAIYLALLPIVFMPGLHPLRVRLLAPMSRPPTPAERARLRPAWQAVIGRVSKGSDRRYQIRVIDSYELNAYASGARLVVVTSGALQALSQSELEAVLSHELGHHAGMHPIVLLATRWLTQPIGWFQSLLVLAHNLLAGITNWLITSGWLLLVANIVLLVPRFVIGVLTVVWRYTILLLLFFGRQAEHRADATAVKLGYGPSLIQALEAMEELARTQNPNGLSDASLAEAGLPTRKSLWDTHPSTFKRVQKIRRALTRAEAVRS